jgi:hypothetical protein
VGKGSGQLVQQLIGQFPQPIRVGCRELWEYCWQQLN